jgi:hypothetical protein
MALEQFDDTGNEAGQRLAAYAIRAVIYAATKRGSRLSGRSTF